MPDVIIGHLFGKVKMVLGLNRNLTALVRGSVLLTDFVLDFDRKRSITTRT